MDENSVTKSKSMTKDEVDLLVDLISKQPSIFSKETSAVVNKNKTDAWCNLTEYFNASTGVYRTKDQLKAKWDNLKKSARKRSQEIRLDCSKTGGGKPTHFPKDETLLKVASLLGSTCTGFKVPFGGDAVKPSSKIPCNEASDEDSMDVLIFEEAEINMDDAPAKLELEGLLGATATDMPTTSKTPRINKDNTPAKRRLELGGLGDSGIDMPTSKTPRINKGKQLKGEGRLERNLAIAKYYEKKTEKLDLEIKVLKLEYAKKTNESGM